MVKKNFLEKLPGDIKNNVIVKKGLIEFKNVNKLSINCLKKKRKR
jgi:hypothetical protein